MILTNCPNFSILLLLVTLFSTEARPQEPIKNVSTYSDITHIKKGANHTFIRDNVNKTKTRILYRGNHRTDGFVEDFTDQDIIFPDTYQVIFENLPRIEGAPNCAKGSTYCENFDAYPYHQVEDILQRRHFHNDLFGKDEPPDDAKQIITNRIGEVEEFFCSSVQKTIFPKVGKNKNNKWKFIINQEETEGYIQGVRIEVCRQEGSACNLIRGLPDGYVTSCKQKYILRRLMSLSSNGDPVPDTFQLPSACCCAYRKDVSFLRSFGTAITPVEDRSAP